MSFAGIWGALPTAAVISILGDWEYTCANFQGLAEFSARAAREGRYVVFTVDQ